MKLHETSMLVAFNLEILNGCRWGCTGCTVDKDGQLPYTEQDKQKFLSLLDDLEANGHVLTNIGIGPVDFMSATNTKQVLDPEFIRPILSRFGTVTLNSTFLSITNQINQTKAPHNTIGEWGSFLATLLKDYTYKFTIPIEPRHYKNAKYLQKIFLARDTLISYISTLAPTSHYSKSYLTGNISAYHEYNEDPLTNDKVTFAEYSHDFYSQTSGGHMDLVVTDGRLGVNTKQKKDKLLHSLQYLNELYNNSVSAATRTVINFTYGKPHEGFDKDYVYRNGRLYAPPFIGERLVILDEAFAIEEGAPWTTDTLLRHDAQKMVEQLNYAQQTTECMNCTYTGSCVGRGTLSIMESLGVVDCLAPKKSFNVVRQARR